MHRGEVRLVGLDDGAILQQIAASLENSEHCPLSDLALWAEAAITSPTRFASGAGQHCQHNTHDGHCALRTAGGCLCASARGRWLPVRGGGEAEGRTTLTSRHKRQALALLTGSILTSSECARPEDVGREGAVRRWSSHRRPSRRPSSQSSGVCQSCSCTICHCKVPQSHLGWRDFW